MSRIRYTLVRVLAVTLEAIDIAIVVSAFVACITFLYLLLITPPTVL